MDKKLDKSQIIIKGAIEASFKLGYQKVLQDILNSLPEKKTMEAKELEYTRLGTGMTTEQAIYLHIGSNAMLKLVHERIEKLRK